VTSKQYPYVKTNKHPFTAAKSELDHLFRRYTFHALEYEDDQTLTGSSSSERLRDFMTWLNSDMNNLLSDEE